MTIDHTPQTAMALKLSEINSILEDYQRCNRGSNHIDMIEWRNQQIGVLKDELQRRGADDKPLGIKEKSRKGPYFTILLLIAFFSLSSCLTTKTTVGNYKAATGQTYTASKGKSVFLFWGLVPASRAKLYGPESCQVVTRLNTFDVLITSLTAGLIIPTTTRINAKR